MLRRPLLAGKLSLFLRNMNRVASKSNQSFFLKISISGRPHSPFTLISLITACPRLQIVMCRDREKLMSKTRGDWASYFRYVSTHLRVWCRRFNQCVSLLMFIPKVLHFVSILQGEAFEIDPTNGQISLKKQLDFESSNKIYYLNVTATVSWTETF